MKQIHNLMRRQIRKHFGDSFSIPEDFQSFFEAVNSAYWESDTDRGMLERALELSSQELLQTNSEMMALIQAFPDVLLWLDADGTVTGYKAGGATDLHIKIGELVGKRIDEAMGEAGIFLNEANKLVRTHGSPTSIEYAVAAGNSERYYEARLMPLFNDQVFAVIRDITTAKKMEDELRDHRAHLEEMVDERTAELKTANEKLSREIIDRKRAERTLMAERQRLFSLLEGLPAFVCLITTDCRITFSNSFFRKHFGEPSEKYCHEIYHGIKEPCENCSTLRALKTNKPVEMVWQKQDGKYFHIYDYPFYDVDGSRQVLRLGIDITENKRAEAELRQSEERFSRAFNANPNIMFILAYNVLHDDAVFIDVNKSFEQITGYSREEVIGCTFLKLDMWEKQEDKYGIIEMVRENKEVRNLELNIIIKTGEVKTCLISVEPIEFGGRKSLLVSANDVTERKRIESEMARLERLSLVGEMAAGIGHELRNPMTAVKGFLQLLNAKEEYAKHKEFFDLMIDEMDRANSIITEFLSLAKDRVVELKTHNLNKIIKAISPLIDADGAVTDNQVVFELEDVQDLSLNEKEIRQLIFNLTRNGLEAMLPGGVLTVRTFMEGGQAVLSVQDQGKGIEPDVLEKIGTPFFTTKDHGTGLGLAVCYSIADRHNAKIDVVSSPTGSVFYVRFKAL